MALYRLSVSKVRRSRGESAVGKSAYQAGELIGDERTGSKYDHRGKRVLSSGVVLPFDPAEAGFKMDRSTIWNMAEAAENRKNSVTGRWIKVALPHEADEAANTNAVLKFCQHLAARYKVVADYAIHPPDKGSDQRNIHAHILISSRAIGPDGFGAKTRELDDRTSGPKEIKAMRAEWASLQNEALTASGRGERVDHRSYKERGIDLVPGIHMGSKATYLERQGVETEKGRVNRRIEAINESKKSEAAQAAKLDPAMAKEALRAVRDLDNLYRPDNDIIEQLLDQTELSGERIMLEEARGQLRDAEKERREAEDEYAEALENRQGLARKLTRLWPGEARAQDKEISEKMERRQEAARREADARNEAKKRIPRRIRQLEGQIADRDERIREGRKESEARISRAKEAFEAEYGALGDPPPPWLAKGHPRPSVLARQAEKDPGGLTAGPAWGPKASLPPASEIDQYWRRRIGKPWSMSNGDILFYNDNVPKGEDPKVMKLSPNKITLYKDDDDSIKAMLELARATFGDVPLLFRGPEAFKRRAAEMAAEMGIKVSDGRPKPKPEPERGPRPTM